MDEILTEAELAEYLKLPPNTLKYWRTLGKGPRWFRAGKHVRYRESAVMEWQAEQEQVARSAR